jgi:hypothetical protein
MHECSRSVAWTLSTHAETCIAGLSRGRFQTDGRTDDRTMAAGASVT